jgi:hypothetical protein
MRIGRLAAVGAFFVLIGVALPLSAQNFATDIPLPSGGASVCCLPLQRPLMPF